VVSARVCRAFSLTDVSHDDLATCTRCALSLTRQRVVIGSGPAQARLVVVGEAPGRSEDEGGEPFIGRSGQLLVGLIEAELGLRREDYFITNVVKCRPPENRTPRVREIKCCRPWLEEQLLSRRTSVVLAVGNTAGRAVFGYREALRDVHGTYFDGELARGLVTFHPAAALRGGPSVVAMIREDLGRLRALWESV